MPLTTTGVAPLFQVFDMHASIAFYRDVLGFEVLEKYEPDGHLYWAMLRLGDSIVMLNAKYEDDKRPASPPAADHQDVALYFGCPDVDQAYEALCEKIPNLRPPKVAFYGMKQLYLTDPDGFTLCFQQKA